MIRKIDLVGWYLNGATAGAPATARLVETSLDANQETTAFHPEHKPDIDQFAWGGPTFDVPGSTRLNSSACDKIAAAFAAWVD